VPFFFEGLTIFSLLLEKVCSDNIVILHFTIKKGRIKMSIQEKTDGLPAGKWVLDTLHSDEFDGTSLDLKKWYDYAPNWRGRREYINRKANVSVSSGCLNLAVRKLQESEMEAEDLAEGILPNTMPIVKSVDRVRYGYFECSAKGCPAEVRNAFWLYDPLSDRLHEKYTPGNCSEEIDIYEFIGKFNSAEHPPYFIGAHVHRFATPYVEGVVNSVKTVLPDEGGKLVVDWAPADAFHTYGLLWMPDRIAWYVDGKEYYRRENDYFHRPLHIVFDCELAAWGGAEVANFDEAHSGAAHQVQYFRRWIPAQN